MLFADDAVLFGKSLLCLQSSCSLYQKLLAVYGLEFNTSKRVAVHLRCDGKRERWFVTLKSQWLIHRSSVRNIKVAEEYKYLGLGTNLGVGQTSAK